MTASLFVHRLARRHARPACVCALAGAAVMLGACAAGRSYGERTILDSLRDAGVERPGPDGQWVRDSSERDSVVAASSAAAPDYAAALPETGEVTLADLLRVAEAQNARLAATRSEAGVAAGRAWQAWLYPNPSVEVEAEEITFGDGADGSEVKVGVSQPIVLGGRREAAVNAAEAERDARLWDAAAMRRELFGDVSGEFSQLVSLRKQARLYGELRVVIEGTLEVARTRVEARAAPEMELIRVRVELQRLEVAARRVDRQMESAERRLSSLLGGAPVDAERLAEPADSALTPLDFAALEGSVRATHPSLAALEQEIAAAESRLAAARAERTPDLELRAAVGYSDAADDGVVELGAGMALPLWDRKQGAILAERFGVLRAQQELAAKGDALAAALADAVGEYETAREEATAMRSAIVPDAQRAFELTRTAYEAGRASFLDVFDAQRTLVEARVALVETEGRAAAALAQVGGIAGPREAGATIDAIEAEGRP